MTSAESFDDNATPIDGIRLEIYEPDFIVLPITEKRLDTSATFVQFNLLIINSSSNPLPRNIYGMLFPELVTSDGQALQHQENIERQASQPRGQGVKPPQQPFVWGAKQVVRFFSGLRNRLRAIVWRRELQNAALLRASRRSVRLDVWLFWRNNQLVLQFELDRLCFFEALQPGQYRLRFVWGNVGSNKATQFANLRLVTTATPNNSAIEVDGIRFETLVPEPEIAVRPKKSGESGVKIPVRFGFRITNNTSNAIRFSLFASLIPKLADPNGQELQGNYVRTIEFRPRESDFPLLMPSEFVTYFAKADMVRHKDNQLTLIIGSGDGGLWLFEYINTDKYKIQFIYCNKKAIKEVIDSETKGKRTLEDIWIGLVHTPYVDFRFRSVAV